MPSEACSLSANSIIPWYTLNSKEDTLSENKKFNHERALSNSYKFNWNISPPPRDSPRVNQSMSFIYLCTYKFWTGFFKRRFPFCAFVIWVRKSPVAVIRDKKSLVPYWQATMQADVVMVALMTCVGRFPGPWPLALLGGGVRAGVNQRKWTNSRW